MNRRSFFTMIAAMFVARNIPMPVADTFPVRLEPGEWILTGVDWGKHPSYSVLSWIDEHGHEHVLTGIKPITMRDITR
jgi:hypothetical protein